MWAQVIASSLLKGGIYALVSVGLTLIFGVLRRVNFAHGEFVMLGMYAAYWLYQSYGVDPYFAALLVAPLFYVGGVVLERFIIRPLVSAPETSVIFTTLALSIIFQNTAQLLWTPNYRSIQLAYSTSGLRLGPVILNHTLLIASAVGLLLCVALHLVLRRTFVGRAILATTQDRQTAELMGVDIQRVHAVAYAVGAAFAGVAGALLMPIYPVFPGVGTQFILVSFVVVTVGGLGSIPGAIFGGFVIALVGGISSVLMDPGLSPAIFWLMFLFVLIFRPTGIFGLRGLEHMR